MLVPHERCRRWHFRICCLGKRSCCVHARVVDVDDDVRSGLSEMDVFLNALNGWRSVTGSETARFNYKCQVRTQKDPSEVAVMTSGVFDVRLRQKRLVDLAVVVDANYRIVVDYEEKTALVLGKTY